jgi:hypothetical protein
MPSIALIDALSSWTLTHPLPAHANDTLGFCHAIANQPIRDSGFLEIPPMRLAGAIGLSLGMIIARWRERILSKQADVGGEQDTAAHMRQIGEAVMRRRPSSAHLSGYGNGNGNGRRHVSDPSNNDIREALLAGQLSPDDNHHGGEQKHAALLGSDNTPSGLIARTEESADQMAKTWANNAHYFDVHRWALNWLLVWSIGWLAYTLGNPKNRLEDEKVWSGVLTALGFASSSMYHHFRL